MKAAPPTDTTADKATKLYHLSKGRADMFRFSPDQLEADPDFNERQDYGNLDELAADIEANGVQEPFKVRKEKSGSRIFLINGHRRHRAITTILIPNSRWPEGQTIPCLSEKPGTTAIDRLFMQISCNNGKPYTFLEEARLYQRILREDPTLKPADLARRTGKTKQAISDSLRLVNEASPLLLDRVKNGVLAASTALHIIKQAGPNPADQDALLEAATTAATTAGREHIMPKDIPAPQGAADSDPQSSSSNQKSKITNHQSSISPSSSPISPPPPRFSLYIISDAPAEPTADGLYHETERLVLENPPAGIELLHLLSALDDNGEICYGYRYNTVTHLPDPDRDSSYGTAAEEGMKDSLRLVAAFSSVFNPSSDQQSEINNHQSEIESALHDALCRFYPETGSPEEPQHLAFVATPEAAAKEPTGYKAIVNAPSTHRDGSGPGSGGSGFVSPENGMKSVNKILEDLDGKGIPDRVTAVEIAMRICNGESTPASLKSFLLGK